MTAILNIVIPLVAGLFIIAAAISVFRAIRNRSQSSRLTYGVGRQEARRAMQVAFLRGGILLVVGLIVLGVYGLSGLPGNASPEEPAGSAETPLSPATMTLPVLPPTNTPTLSPTSEPTTAVETPQPSPTTAALEPTGTPAQAPTPLPSAIVNSEVGLYLREAPGGTQELELLPAGTVLILLPGRETVDGVEWQEVRAPSGLEGWVAVDFIVYQ